MPVSNGKSLIFSFNIFLSAFVPIASAAADVSCPKVLPETIQTVVVELPGWMAQQYSTKHILTSFRVNLGNSGASNGAIYDNRLLTKDPFGEERETLSWNLLTLVEPYIICGYSGTSIVLTRGVTGFSSCQVTNQKKRTAPRFELISASCQ